MEDFIVVTAENLEAVMDAAKSDQAREFEPGCETWIVRDADGETGRMSRWPNGGRGAIQWGAGSQWGDWDEDGNLVIDSDADGEREVIDETGKIVRASTLQMTVKLGRIREFLLMGEPVATDNATVFELDNGLKVTGEGFTIIAGDKDVSFDGDVNAFIEWLADIRAHTFSDAEVSYLCVL